MKWTHYIAGMILAMTFMAGCRHTSQTPLLTAAEAFLPAEPDSADARLKQVDVQQLRGDEEEAWYALLRTMTDALQRKQPLNDTLVNRAYTYYGSASDLGTSSDPELLRRFAQSALYMGDCYAAVDSAKACEDCYRQVIRISEKAQDWHTCYIAYERLADQVQWSNPEEALELINKAIETYGKCNDDIANLLSLYHCAAHYAFQIAYLHGKDFQETIALVQEEYKLAVEHELPMFENQALNLFALIYWTQGEYQLALSYAKQIKLKSLNKDYELAWNRTLAQCYLSCDSLAQAKIVLNQLTSTDNKKEAYLYARSLAELSIQYDEGDSVLLYLDSALNIAESMYFDALQAKDDYYQDNLLKEKEKDELLYKVKLKTWLLGGGSACVLILSLFIIWIQKERKRRTEIELQLLKEKHEKEEEKARHLQHEMELLQDRQQALEDSQQKKVAVIEHLQRYIIERSDITTKLKDGASAHQMTPKDWKTVEQLLDEIDEGRISKIRERYKDISIDDIRLCMMVRIGLSNPAIGHIFGITPSAVQHRKLTLKKKGFGIADPEVTLDKFLESL